VSRHTVRLTQTGRLCLIGHSEGVPPDLCCHTNYQSASDRTLHWHRDIAAVRGRAWARPLRLCALTVRCCEQTLFFFCAVMAAAAAVWAPTSSQLARVPRCATRPTAADPPSSHALPAARAGAALYKCGVAVQPATAVSTSGQWCLQHQERRKSAARHAQR